MSKIKLTDKNVVTLRGESNRETNYRDSQYPGLYLRITAKGVCSFVLRYSVVGGNASAHWGRCAARNRRTA